MDKDKEGNRRNNEFERGSEEDFDSFDYSDSNSKWVEFCDFCGNEHEADSMTLIGSKFICKKCINNNKSLFKR